MKNIQVTAKTKDEAKDQWRALKRRLRSGDIKFEEYAAAKRKLKPIILAG